MSSLEQKALQDIVEVRRMPIRTWIATKIAGDQLALTSDATTTPGYPWTFAEANKRPIGSMFALDITDGDLEDMWRRYQLARRIIDSPVEEALANGHVVKINGQESKQATNLYNKYSSKWNRFFKLVLLYGHSEMIFGWSDDQFLWPDTPPQEGEVFTYLQPVPKFYEVELKETEFIPIKIESLTVNFGAQNLTLHPSRFIHSMKPKLIEEDKQGESELLPIANLLQVQIHADWSIGQALFRRASGLLGVFAPKRTVTDAEKTEAIGSVSNHNSKTVVYVPFGWNIKDLLKPGGNLAIARTYRVILEQISAGSGIPVSILIGAQRNQISEEDKQTYFRHIGKIQNNLMTPTLTKFYREGQRAAFVENGEITIDWETPESKTPLQKVREETEIGAMKLLQARMAKSADDEGVIQNEELGPPTQDLVKLISKARK